MVSQQKFKSIYLRGYKTDSLNTKGFVLAFGKKDRELYKSISFLSSQEVRELLNISSFKELEKVAQIESLPLNTYCLWQLRKQSTLNRNTKSNGTLDPLYATFRGGSKNPLHSWYSFLEGYSPEFVEHILDNFIPEANIIYDPFAGTGVTPMVASKRGLTSLYSEVNPLLQFLVKTKTDASLLSSRQRSKVLGNLKTINGDIKKLIRESSPNKELLSNYFESFDKSQFFDNATFRLVLKARTLVDEISYSNQLTANLLQVAILNALIPSSLLKRAGDVRYRTEKELRQKTNFIEELGKNLSNIINDIETTESLPTRSLLITEDAREIRSLPAMKIDAVITSPPYLNGTNYFRNTKVELWFLRSIKTKDDLTEFRKSSVTAGINDVSLKSPSAFVTKEISKVVQKLSQKSYDKRIPKMVWDYFQDMETVFKGLKTHLSDNATIAIDIGDSVYGGVKVPTDELLIGVLKKLGYRLQSNIILRKRMSRNGDVLKQVLMIFSAPTKKAKRTGGIKNNELLKNWSTFKKNLPHQKLPFSKRNWGHPLHSLCSYQGKIKPSLAYFLVKNFTHPGQRMLDPFAGVGTIPFEGASNGVTSFGFDISPAAIFIAKAKLGITDYSEAKKVIKRLERFIEYSDIDKNDLLQAKKFGFNKKLDEYYHPKTLGEILKARQFFRDHIPSSPSELLVISSLLHILHGNRPYSLSRRSHGITPFAPTGRFEYRPLIPRLVEKVKRSLKTELPSTFVPGEMHYQDATLLWPKHIKNLDAVITSPPFFDSTRFYLANWLRLWFSGWDQDDFQKKSPNFIDEKQKLGFDIYESMLRQSRERLRPGGVLVFHLGLSNKCDMADKLQEVAQPWFKTLDIFEESVENGESHGIRDKGTVVKHQFLILG